MIGPAMNLSSVYFGELLRRSTCKPKETHPNQLKSTKCYQHLKNSKNTLEKEGCACGGYKEDMYIL